MYTFVNKPHCTIIRDDSVEKHFPSVKCPEKCSQNVLGVKVPLPYTINFRIKQFTDVKGFSGSYLGRAGDGSIRVHYTEKRSIQ